MELSFKKSFRVKDTNISRERKREKGINHYLSTYYITDTSQMFIFERMDMSRGGAGRQRETQNPKKAPGSELSAQSPKWGLNSQTER